MKSVETACEYSLEAKSILKITVSSGSNYNSQI